MARVILHIGAHKTATSYLQRCFFHNREQLEQAGVFYPDLGPNPAHHILVAPWIDVPEIPAEYFGGGGPDGLWQRFVAEYAGKDGVVFLSAEPFSRAQSQAVDMAELAARLRDFESVQIIYAVRGQVDLIQSIWSQRAKSAKAPAFRNFVAAALSDHQASGLWVDHGRVLDHVETGFKPDQITVFDFDQIRAAPGGVVQAFLDVLGAAVSADHMTPLDDRAVNVSPDPLSLYLAHQISGRQVPDGALMDVLSRCISTCAEGRKTLGYSRDEIVQIETEFAPLNDAFVARVQKHQPGFSFAIPDSHSTAFCRDDLKLRHWTMIARKLHGS
ncbi:MAG: sulfotransferase domain-containing protein [Sulfitobacter sp.]